MSDVKILVEYLVDAETPGDALDVIETMLDNGDPQDRINNHEHDTAGPLRVQKASAWIQDVDGEMADRAKAIELALELPLLFHHGGPWTPRDRARWKEITGLDEATTKVMCDHIRKVLS